MHGTILADRTNGRAYATVLRRSVCLSVCDVLYVACQIVDRTHTTNDLDLCLEIALIKFCGPNIRPYHNNEFKFKFT